MRFRRVVKVGGSLLDLPDIADRLRRWMSWQSPGQNVLIVGGGRLADAVRDYDQIHRLRPSESHCLAVQAMSVTARLVANLLTESKLATDWKQVRHDDSPLAILDIADFLAQDEPALAGVRLPQSWATTSDSIAARLALAMEADELALLKSRLAPEAKTLEAASACDLVDKRFAPSAAELKSVRVINLRDDAFGEQRLSTPYGG